MYIHVFSFQNKTSLKSGEQLNLFTRYESVSNALEIICLL